MDNLSEKIRRAAVTYRKYGWNVIPLKSFLKAPSSANDRLPVFWRSTSGETSQEPREGILGWGMTRGWKVLMERLATDEEFDYMFSGDDITGLGVITGKVSDVYVLDEDSYKDGGLRVLEDSPLVQETANGGKHFFYRYSDKIPQIGFRQGVNVEGKGEGGFVVLAPSQVLKNDGKTMGEYRWVKKCKPNELPVIEFSAVKSFIPPESGSYIPYDELIAVEEGGRHIAMRSLIIKKLNDSYSHREDWDGYIKREVAIHNKLYKPPLPDQELTRLFEDAKKFVVLNPPTRKQEASPIVQQKITKAKKLTEIKGDRVKEKDFEKLAASTGYKGLDAMIVGFIPGHLYTLTGETNIGKTAMCSNFAVNVAKQGKNVLYCALEPGNSILDYIASVVHQKKFSDLTEDDYDVSSKISGDICVFGSDEISTPQDLLEAIETQNQYQLIIIDHIGYFVKDNNNVWNEQSNIIKKLALLAKKKIVPILLIAHINKAASKKDAPLTFNDISGSASFKQDSTDVWILERKGKAKKNEDGAEWQDYEDEGFIKVAKSKSGSGKNGLVRIYLNPGMAKVDEYKSIHRFAREEPTHRPYPWEVKQDNDLF